MKKRILPLLAVCASSILPVTASEKIYIDQEELKSSNNAFHIHQGNNVWIETNTIHRDATGFYTHEESIARTFKDNKYKGDYKKTWKCPYCYSYWPIGTPCQNPSCPSKYK